MEKEQAKSLIEETFNSKFNKEQYTKFAINLLDGLDTEKQFTRQNLYVKESFRNYIESYGRIGKYTDAQGNDFEVLWVNLKKETALDRARTMQRNFIAWYLNGGVGDVIRHNALVAFYNEEIPDWRFSFVKLEADLAENDKGQLKVINNFTAAKRYSFLVGEQEPNHTAQARLIDVLAKEKPVLSDIEEAFNIEKVSKEFFATYKELFLQLVDNLKAIRKNEQSQRINTEFGLKRLKEADFCKKLMGQLVFLYFIQKKGWLGVKRDESWGNGDKRFLRNTFKKAVVEGKNFFNDYMEPLFYNALANGERDYNMFELLDCKIPFLNGGLFEPISDYDWVNTDIIFDNTIFSNNTKTKDGDIGTGILDVFDRYNFTVKEDEPLEKEVAIDPEMLGKVFEELLEVEDRKSKGAFYTPREIVHYMCQESLINYLCTELEATEESFIKTENKQIELIEPDIKQLDFENKITKQAIADFIHHADKIAQNEAIAKAKEKSGDLGKTYDYQLDQCIRLNAKQIDDALQNIKICDPAIGSGAFPVGMMNEIVRVRMALVESGYINRTKHRTPYDYKRQAIQNSIYGVDIDCGAIEIAKLRLWLSLIVDENDIENIKPLPNLDYKIVCGDSLLGLENVIVQIDLQNKLSELTKLHFDETRKTKKKEYKRDIDAILEEIFKMAKSLNCDATFDFKLFFHEVFEGRGFDIIIGNPPYVSNKGTTIKQKKDYEKKYGISDDLYNYFFINSMDLLKDGGTLGFITSDTYLTINSKINLRELFQRNRILELIKTDNVFENAMVSPAILIIAKENNENQNYNFVFKDAINDFNLPKKEIIDVETYRSAVNKVFFFPNLFNLSFYSRFNETINSLYNTWWFAISTSKNITKNSLLLNNYRENLKENDLALLGCLTEGGQGLATANNGKYVAIKKSTKWAKNVVESRPKKLAEAIKKEKIKELENITDTKSYLDSLSEKEIANLFDNLKEKYGRDIFGQGYIYKLIEDNEIASVETLTEEEKEKGIDLSKPYYVPYDKGDKDGNRWYLETPFCIAWNKENVKFLKENSGKKGEGMPVVRNPQFYFKSGFCWGNVLNPHARLLKTKMKDKSINDVGSMSLNSIIPNIPNFYFVALLNSNLMFDYYRNFINNTVNIQINDIRQLPIKIPTTEFLRNLKELFDCAYSIKKEQFAGNISDDKAGKDLIPIEEQIDLLIYKFYDISYQEILTIDPKFKISETDYNNYKIE